MHVKAKGIEQPDLLKLLFAIDSTPRWKVRKILKSGPATIVLWEDGSKTVVKCAPDEEPNDYAAFTAALGIKLFKSNSNLKRMIAEKTVVQKPRKKGKADG